MHFWIDLMSSVLTKLIYFFYFFAFLKSYGTKCVFSLGRNLTDLPLRSISAGVYVEIHISQGKIHHVPCVLALRKNRKENAKGSDFCFYCRFEQILLGWERILLTCPFSNKQKLTKLKMTKRAKEFTYLHYSLSISMSREVFTGVTSNSQSNHYCVPILHNLSRGVGTRGVNSRWLLLEILFPSQPQSVVQVWLH